MSKEISKEKFLNKVKKKNKTTSNVVIIIVLSAIIIGAIAAAALWWFGFSDITIDEGNNPFENTSDMQNTPVSNNGEDGENDVLDIIRNENSHNILFVGKDRVGSNTDVILLINFNADSQTISVLQIPRDTYMDSEHNVSDRSKRVNAIYAYGSIDTGSVEGGLEALEKAVEDCFAVTIDSYFMVNLSGFRKIVDAIGGVWVDVPFDMYYEDPEQDLYIDLKKGPTLLDGNKAEQFVRFRNDYAEGDLGRVQAQKIFLTALVNKLLSPEWYTIDKLTNVANYVLDCSTTNMKASDIAGYVKKADLSKLSAESIVFYTAPGESYQRSNGAWYYSLYLEESRQVINKAFNVYNVEIEEKHMALKEESHIYQSVDVDGDTASDLKENPPHIYLDQNKISQNTPEVPDDSSVEAGVVTDTPQESGEKTSDEQSVEQFPDEETEQLYEEPDVTHENNDINDSDEEAYESTEELPGEDTIQNGEGEEPVDDNADISESENADILDTDSEKIDYKNETTADEKEDTVNE